MDEVVETVIIKIDNRQFLLGLDKMFRDAQKKYEVEVLLPTAESICRDLSLDISNGPAGGYYSETPELSRFFNVMRTIQEVNATDGTRISDQEGMTKLLTYAGSGIFGDTVASEKLLPKKNSPLEFALKETYPDWNVEHIVQYAHATVTATTDYSLVGLACLAADPVVITALKESTILYSGEIAGASRRKIVYKYELEINPEIQARGEKMINEFNSMTGASIPPATNDGAEAYFHAYRKADIGMRCACLGQDGDKRFYHWAIAFDPAMGHKVHEFWSNHRWTTQEYKEKNGKVD